MARIRTIKPELATSLTVANWSLLAQALWPRLFCHVDDEGRCVLEPRLLAAAIAPLVDDCTPSTMSDVVKEWESTGSVQTYEVDGRAYLQVCEWEDHQYIKHKKDSEFPGPEQADSDVTPGRPPADPQPTPSLLPDGSVEQGTGNREGNREDGTADADTVEDVPDFDTWWDAYRDVARGRPTGYGNRKPAERAWKKLTDVEKRDALDAVPVYGRLLTVEDATRSDAYPAKHGSTWLNQREFEDLDERLEDREASPKQVRAAQAAGTCDDCGQYLNRHNDKTCQKVRAA